MYMIPLLKSVFSEKEFKGIFRMLQSFRIIEFFVFPIRCKSQREQKTAQKIKELMARLTDSLSGT
jgi:hypothetical protein